MTIDARLLKYQTAPCLSHPVAVLELVWAAGAGKHVPYTTAEFLVTIAWAYFTLQGNFVIASWTAWLILIKTFAWFVERA